GYAADARGNGIAYVRAGAASAEQLARVPFRVRRHAQLQGHEIGYAAVRAVLRALREWNVSRIRISLEDARLVDELTGRCDVASEIVLPYVRLRCALNAFDAAAVVVGGDADLTQRARAEIAMHAAA
ncbi:MAG TPA: hypothetical protein VMF61_15845, partial [Candidatus Acidoferrales bacterium]|nr:hypothetical protein [Candidatus Acidoferrales bacterium]